MIQPKRKQLLYDTEGDNIKIPDFNIKSRVVTRHIEPIQPFTPEPPSTVQRQSETNKRPGGIDPYYRLIKPTKNITQNKSETNERPGDIDPYYRFITPTKNITQNKSETNERPGGIGPFYKHMNPNKNITQSETNVRPGGNDKYYNKMVNDNNPQDLIYKALQGPNITDAEGLRRAYESPSNTYMYKGVLFVSGTKGGVFGSDMRENVRYIGVPNIKSAITYYATQAGKMATLAFPEESLIADIGFGVDMAIDKNSMKNEMKKELTPDIESLTRFKDAEQAYLYNKNYIQRVVGDSSGAAVIQALKEKYPDIQGGRGYGAPIVDIFGRAKIKTALQTEREVRNAQYGDKISNVPEKFVNDKFQNVIETALGLDDIKTSKDTGIQQIRAAGDIVAGLNNGADVTVVPSVSDVLSKNTLTHSYDLTAQYSTTKDTTQYANGFVNDDKSISLVQ